MANLQNVHLTPDEGAEDLYSGYEYSAIADVSIDILCNVNIIRNYVSKIFRSTKNPPVYPLTSKCF